MIRIRKHKGIISPVGVVQSLVMVVLSVVQSISGQNPLEGMIPVQVKNESMLVDKQYINYSLAGIDHDTRKLLSESKLPVRGTIPTDSLVHFINDLFQTFILSGFPLVLIDRLELTYQNTGERLQSATIYLSSGKEVILTNATIIGLDTSFLKMQPIGAAHNSQLSKSAIYSDVAAILDQITDLGYPYASVVIEPSEICEQEDYINCGIKYIVDLGQFTRIDKINFPGHGYVQESLLRQESRLYRGMVFNRSAFLHAERRLSRLNYIELAGEMELIRTGTGTADIYFPVTVNPVNQFSGIAAVNPGSSGLHGEFQVGFGNIFGTGREFKFEWFGLNPNRRGITTEYTEPWLFNRPLKLKLALSNWQNSGGRIIVFEENEPDSTISTITTTVSGGLEWEVSDGIFADLVFNRDRTNYNKLSGNSLSVIGNRFNAGVRVVQLDDDWNPYRGYTIGYHTGRGFRTTPADSRRTTLTMEKIKYVQAIPLSSVWVGFLNLEWKDVSGSGIIIDDLVELGGIGSIRGYNEGSILAQAAIWQNAELRFRPEKSSYIGLAFDGAYIYRRESAYYIDKAVYLSTGITAGTATNRGKIGLDISVAQGERLSRARLHVKMVTYF